jgi:hypothetical protein
MSSPSHPKVPAFVYLFKELKNFRELESRIVALPTEKERGDAFEVFAEAYLMTQGMEKPKTIWTSERIPPSLTKKLAFAKRDTPHEPQGRKTAPNKECSYRTRSQPATAYRNRSFRSEELSRTQLL